MRVPIDAIDQTIANPRQIPAPQAADLALQGSLRSLGMLEPILVKPAGDEGRYTLLAGRRRLAAARALGWPDVPVHSLAMTGDEPAGLATAIGAAENLVRMPMHPVDCWRACQLLCQQTGWSVEQASQSLGLPPGMTARMAHLADMAPEMIAALGRGELPPMAQLRVIAMAGHDQQREALRAGTIEAQTRISWDRVAAACQRRRIPRLFALFEPALLAWQEDWLAEPDDPMRSTTDAVDDFMARQHAVLEAEAAHAEGRVILIDDPGPAEREQPPAGWLRVFGEIPTRWRKEDPRRVFVFIQQSGADMGRVKRLLAEPTRALPADAPRAEPQRAGFSRQVRGALAKLKSQALREQLDQRRFDGAGAMLHLLLLALECDNLRRRYDVARKLVDPDGRPRDVDDRTLCNVAAAVIGDLVSYDDPAQPSSGVAGTWIAHAVGLDVVRADTPEVLAGLRKPALISLAQSHGLAWHGTAGELRTRLTGSLPAWRAADFAAAGPGEI